MECLTTDQILKLLKCSNALFNVYNTAVLQSICLSCIWCQWWYFALHNFFSYQRPSFDEPTAMKLVYCHPASRWTFNSSDIAILERAKLVRPVYLPQVKLPEDWVKITKICYERWGNLVTWKTGRRRTQIFPTSVHLAMAALQLRPNYQRKEFFFLLRDAPGVVLYFWNIQVK